jgi:ElaB/YqjD/DUF883 family membrane-anchored ribosome-binding protein
LTKTSLVTIFPGPDAFVLRFWSSASYRLADRPLCRRATRQHRRLPGQRAEKGQGSKVKWRVDCGCGASGKATDQARNAAQHVEEFANNAAQQGREAGERIQEVAGNVKGAVDKSIKDQPMVTLAVAAAAGFVLGALWKS